MISFLGRNALHLAAKYGHALCLQKLLQVVKVVNTLTLLLGLQIVDVFSRHFWDLRSKKIVG